VPERQWVPTGEAVEVPSHRQLSALAELERRREAAARTSEHLWLVAVTYFASDQVLGAFTDDDPHNLPMLDGENIAMPPGLVCWICEETYSTRIAHRKCRGEPRRG
jgi:hypothetical protein